MILTLVKLMQTRIIGQPRRGSEAQQRKVDGYTYSFVLNIKRQDLSMDEIEQVCTECLDRVFGFPDTVNSVKDMEISLDIPSGQYSWRFTTLDKVKELTEDSYSAEITWSVRAMSGEDYGITSEKPVEYIDNARYLVKIAVDRLSLNEVEELLD